MSMFTRHLLFDHLFALIHWYNIPVSYAILLFTVSDLTSITNLNWCWTGCWFLVFGCCFCFTSIPSIFLELFLHWSPVAYWAPTDLGSTFFNVLSFGLYILFIGFSSQEHWSGLSFPSPVGHILSDLSTMTSTLWWPHTTWLSFTELHKAVVHVIRLTSCLWLWFQSALWCPLPVPTFLLGFRLTWTWDISSLLFQQSATHAL